MLTCALKHVGGTVFRYQHEDAWAEVMFNEWGADGLKVDHMCQGVNCGTGVQGHMMAVEYACVQCPPPFPPTPTAVRIASTPSCHRAQTMFSSIVPAWVSALSLLIYYYYC